jgi:hypothetical protein
MIEEMKLLKDIDHLFLSLRKNLEIPLRQPLLNYSFGGVVNNKYVYLDPEHRRLLAKGINILDQGYDFADRDYYDGLETVKPCDMEILEENGIWVALDTSMPKWLKEIGDKRKKEREMLRKKYK